MSKPTNNNTGIELLRIIAILLLIIYHVSLIGTEGDYPPYLNAILSITKMGWVGTDLFLAIAGFFCVNSIFKYKSQNLNYFDYLKNRVLRIVPSYYLFLIVYLIFGIELINLLGNSFALNDGFLISLITFTSNISFSNGMWSGVALEGMFSIALLVQLFIFFGFILFYIKNIKLLLIIFLCFELLAITLRIQFGVDHFWRSYFFTLTRIDAFLMGLTLGILYSNFKAKEHFSSNAVIIFCSALILLTLTVYLTQGLYFKNPLMLHLAYPVIALFAASLINLSYRYEINTLWLKKLSKLGKIAYPIYLLKLPVIYLVYSALLLFFAEINPVVFKGLFFISAIFACFLTAGGWHYLIKSLFIQSKKFVAQANFKRLIFK
ncbi:acyltransferase [Pseudoalteromonas sp. C2R02]|uniref:acyltransferase family protein n=1 Tax=Pseudoalteromonas sp. C2R02 TaxID=2841565 RepID=UPI001C0839D9|nr:acyltransferase [Pseudoalteromonas sp. C2R02]MBU2969543.1 acyltransferase [Pseudoalteromonas sp. C2R02]